MTHFIKPLQIRLVIVLSIVFFFGACQQNQEVPPNIVYILADDLGYGDLSCYGQQKFSTPNIDKLAHEGLRFTQHYSGSTVCAPSRSALMTGLHTGHMVIRGNKEIQPEGQSPLPANCLTIARLLKNNGYVTGIFGKWGLGFPGSGGEPLNQGFDRFYGYNCQRVAHNYFPGHLWDNRNKVILEENAEGKTKIYAPELIHRKALEFIEANKERPFFAYIPTTIPHSKLEVTQKYLAKYKNKLDAGELSTENLKNKPYYRIKDKRARQHAHEVFASMIAVLDDQVGEIMAKLKELNLDENTIVMFSSDNGPHYEGGGDPDYFNSNANYRGYKRDLYEGGIRVPMIARWPGKISADSETAHLSAFWDVLPTIADIAGLKTQEATDGISFLPTLLGKEQSQQKHDYLYWEFPARGGRKALRMGKWKTVLYNVNNESLKTIELYNLEKDPGETNNIAMHHPRIVEEALHIIKKNRLPSGISEWNYK